MSKENQIAEMAKVICRHYDTPLCKTCGVYDSCMVRIDAETIYSAGYRKQSEGEWRKTTEPLGAHDVDCAACSVCGESWVLDEDFDFDVVADFWNYCPSCGAKMARPEEAPDA